MNGTPRDGFEGVRRRAAEYPADPAAAALAGSRVLARRLALLYAVAAAAVAILALSTWAVSAAGRGPEQRPSIAAIRVDPAAAELSVGEMTRFRVEGELEDGSSVVPDVRWSSSDAQIIDVDASGVATALAPGRATITASVGDLADSATVESGNVIE